MRVNVNIEFSLQARAVAFNARCSVQPEIDNFITWACGTLPNEKLTKCQVFVRGGRHADGKTNLAKEKQN